MSQKIQLALAGNPNSGKSSLFNRLTGLQQQTGNYPGVTVALNKGKIDDQIDCIDLPGAYSLHATSDDEYVLTNILLNDADPDHPDQIVYVLDVTHFEKQFLLLTQIMDLGFDPIIALNMMDDVQKGKVEINIKEIQKIFPDLTIVPISTRSGLGIAQLQIEIQQKTKNKESVSDRAVFFSPNQQEQEAIDFMQNAFNYHGSFQSLLCMQHGDRLNHHTEKEKSTIKKWRDEKGFNSLRSQIDDTMRRYDHFSPLVSKVVKTHSDISSSKSQRLDRVLTHPWVGPVLFIATMILLFQAIFAWATYPMDWIEGAFLFVGQQVSQLLGEGWMTDLVTEGILPGLAGVLVFVPQIAILFLLISLLEEAGYMARAVFLFDRFMQYFGLNGKSIVALISSGACAIPAIMSARSISNSKERLITILVTPFISCSARIPVYAILIAFVIPATTVWGIFNAQGLVFFGLYALGITAALVFSLILHKILKSAGTSSLMIQLPDYKIPNARNVWLRVYHSVKSFVLEAGKIIFFISIILWFLSSYGPGESMEKARQEAISMQRDIPENQRSNFVASKQLEASYAGRIGKWIEPTIEPLGYDWKIGIALFTSFAAREVFVGTMATIYSVGSEEDDLRIRDRMAQEINPKTGGPRYSLATALSLLIFYVLAMQCMSTLAVVKKETGTWKWPIIQFVGMTGLAYLSALIVYQTMIAF